MAEAGFRIQLIENHLSMTMETWSNVNLGAPGLIIAKDAKGTNKAISSLSRIAGSARPD